VIEDPKEEEDHKETETVAKLKVLYHAIRNIIQKTAESNTQTGMEQLSALVTVAAHMATVIMPDKQDQVFNNVPESCIYLFNEICIEEQKIILESIKQMSKDNKTPQSLAQIQEVEKEIEKALSINKKRMNAAQGMKTGTEDILGLKTDLELKFYIIENAVSAIRESLPSLEKEFKELGGQNFVKTLLGAICAHIKLCITSNSPEMFSSLAEQRLFDRIDVQCKKIIAGLLEKDELSDKLFEVKEVMDFKRRIIEQEKRLNRARVPKNDEDESIQKIIELINKKNSGQEFYLN